MTRIPCTACRAPVATGHTLCPEHVEALGEALRSLPTILDDLDITITRQNRMADAHNRIRGDERPVPFAVEASKRHHDLSIAIGRWAETFGVLRYGRGLARAGAPRACARFLVAMLPAIVRHPDSGTMLRDFEALIARARREIDRPPDLFFVGICSVDDCPSDVYATVGAATVACPQCHARHDVAARRAVLLAAVEDQLATATEIVRAIASYGADGEILRLQTISNWRARGRILVRGVTTRGEPRYRLGDALALLREPRRRGNRQNSL